MQNITNHPEYPWSSLHICSNPNLTMNMIYKFPDRNCIYFSSCVSENPGITMQDIINNPEYPWKWDYVLRNEFKKDKKIYVNSKLGRLLLISMLDDYNNDTATLLDNTLLVLCNDYHVNCILSYI